MISQRTLNKQTVFLGSYFEVTVADFQNRQYETIDCRCYFTGLKSQPNSKKTTTNPHNNHCRRKPVKPKKPKPKNAH